MELKPVLASLFTGAQASAIQNKSAHSSGPDMPLSQPLLEGNLFPPKSNQYPSFGFLPSNVQTKFQGTQKSSLQFGNTHPKLDYQLIETIQDPVFGAIEKYKFSNGMELFALKKEDVPLVSFGTLIKTGLINEDFRNNGVSHFLEHLLFKGTPDYGPGVLDHELEALGAGINAWTSWDGTFYYVYEMPKESLAKAIPLHADMVQNALVPTVPLNLERGVVISEIDKYADDPDSVAGKELLDAVWPDHPYGLEILGPKENIQELSRKDILTYYAKHYSPENRAMVVVGDFNINEVLETVASQYNKPFPPKGGEAPGDERVYHSFLDRMPVRAMPNAIGTSQLPSDRILKKDVETASLSIGVDGPIPGTPEGEKELMALNFLSTILAGDSASRLYQDLVETHQVASEIGMYAFTLKERSMIAIEGKTEAKDLPVVKEKILAALAQVASEGVTPEELEKAKLAIESRLANTTERQFNVIGALVKAVSYDSLGKSALGKQLEYAANITAEDVQAVAQKYFKPSRLKTVTMVPKESPKEASLGDAPIAPTGLKFSGSLSHLDQSVKLPGGTELIVRHNPQALNTAISVRVNKGGSRSESIPGESDILTSLMDRGTDTLSAKELQQRLAQKKIHLGISSDADSYTISLQGLSRFKDDIFSILGEVLKGPTSNPEELAFAKNLYQKNYTSYISSTPTAIPQAKLREALYPNHPYGVTGKTIIQNIDRHTPESLRNAFNRLFTKPNMTVAVIGNVPLEEAQEKISGITSHLSDASVTLPKNPLPELTEDQVIAIPKDDLNLAEFYKGWMGQAIEEADRPTLEVISGLLSAGLSSRFTETFREGRRKGEGQAGMCYSVYSQNETNKEGGHFSFYIGTDPKNLTKVQDLFNQELEDLFTVPVPEEELAKTKLLLKKSMVASLQQSGKVVSSLTRHRGLDIDSMLDLLPKLDAVTPEQIMTVAQKYFKKPSVTSVLAPSQALKDHGLLKSES
ncbi:MAG: insulinase family protein [Cyanobacteria bacterium]|nr:insulinase family protein [Cyanobacteriota bacterium]